MTTLFLLTPRRVERQIVGGLRQIGPRSTNCNWCARKQICLQWPTQIAPSPSYRPCWTASTQLTLWRLRSWFCHQQATHHGLLLEQQSSSGPRTNGGMPLSTLRALGLSVVCWSCVPGSPTRKAHRSTSCRSGCLHPPRLPRQRAPAPTRHKLLDLADGEDREASEEEEEEPPRKKSRKNTKSKNAGWLGA